MSNAFLDNLTRFREVLSGVIRGKAAMIDMVLTAVLAEGHVLLEDVPGVGKTTLAKALAASLGLRFARVQFTPDLLPTDILGMNVLDPRDGSFTFHEGPVFSQLLLADEINRASPRTQSALLEAMNEGQALPEAQLDRFPVCLRLGYPGGDDELRMLFDRQRSDPLENLRPVMDTEALLAMQRAVRDVAVADDVARGSGRTTADIVGSIIEETKVPT